MQIINQTSLTVKLTGRAPLILHRFGTMTKCCLARGIRPWEQDVEEAFIDRLPLIPGKTHSANEVESAPWKFEEGAFGVRASVIRKIAIDASKFVKNTTKVNTAGTVHLRSDQSQWCPLTYSRMDVFRSEHKIRKHNFEVLRPIFYDWSLSVQFELMEGTHPGMLLDLHLPIMEVSRSSVPSILP